VILLGSVRNKDRNPYYDAILFWGGALNPFAMDLSTTRGRAQAGAGLTVGVAVPWIAHAAFSGGGATHHVARSIARPSIIRGAALTASNYRAIASGGARTMGFIARNALPSISAAAVGYAIVGAGDSFLRYLTGGMAGILPDANFMNWHG